MLETHLWLPRGAGAPSPLVVFAHGWVGHPRKFTRLFSAWREAGYAVAAPAFPGTTDVVKGRAVFEDVAQQPHDMSFVLDSLLEPRRDLLDAGAVAAAGFSLGGVTTLAVSFGRKLRDPRIRAAIVISGRLGLIGGEHDLGGLPLLVVHGEHDPVVPYADGVDVYRRAAPPKALVTLHVQGHQHPVEDVPATDSDDVVPAVSTAFLDIVLRDDPTAAARLRAAARPPVASLEADGL